VLKLDTFLMSLGAIRSNKLRSALTLVGIILGVASIIAVMTAISVIQKTLEQEMSVLGAQVFQVQKWPSGGFNSQEEQREAMSWPPVTLENAQAIRDQATTVDFVGTELWDSGFVVEYQGEKTSANVTICGGSPEYPENNTHYVEFGRNLSPMDMVAHARVAVIGHAVAEQLFPFIDPIGKKIRVDGRSFEVIGVFISKDSAFGGPYNQMVLIPSGAYTDIYGLIDRQGFPRSVNITVHAKTPELLPDAIEEVRQIVRRDRGLKRGEKDNFHWFTSNSQIKEFNKATMGVKIGAFVLGTIALIVAGIGIMNIMLVSVTERTKEIGLRKSLGARRRNIRNQFLLEAVILCNVGGIIGVLIGIGVGNILSMVTSFEVSIPVGWAVFGLAFCTLVGVSFGMLPALKAAKLNPIEALHYE
jgi:putative ABC transport system permease protein